ncbi:MAG: ABC transporter ATP-binding protein [Gammaproteobacteria bacterium]|nr:ABC transporter ATP-binding protein [Gammaproteobacteria bacterium]
MTLLGPSGCGKTTTLRAIAGLETPHSGTIRLDGELVYSSASNVNVPTERRGLAMVFQSYAIWPHMSVADNVGYGLKVRGDSRGERSDSVRWALNLVEMDGFEKRSAANLSGGQQQRVALARALAVKPKLLLLDEPLSNLDARLRAGMRREMQQLQRQTGVTSIYVTHDQEEALVLSDRIIVMQSGHIAQIGAPAEIYNCPRNAFVADFVGAANLLDGSVREDLSVNGTTVLETRGKQLIHCLNPGYSLQGEATVALRPGFARLSSEPVTESPNNWAGRVKQRVFLGDSYEYIVLCDDKPLVVRGRVDSLHEEGDEVYVSASASQCIVLEPSASVQSS